MSNTTVSTNLPEHVKPQDESAVCWLLDVRKYGIDTANAMHKDA